MSGKRKKIVYIVSHGHTARGAFQTNLVKKLGTNGFEVNVIAKDANEELLNLVHEQNAKLHTYTTKTSRLEYHWQIFRAYVMQDIRENPVLWKRYLSHSKDSSRSKSFKLISTLSYYMGRLSSKMKFLRKLFLKIEKKIYGKKQAFDLLKKINPDAIIATRPVDQMEIELLTIATQLNIKKIFYVLSWDNITSRGTFPSLGDYYLTWGEIMNQELKEYYQVDDAQLFLTGVTHFDIHAQVKNGSLRIESPLNKLGLDASKPYLFFTMSASFYAPNEIDIIEWIAAQVENNHYGEDMQFIVRPHMLNLTKGKSDLSWIERLKKLSSKRVAIDFPDMDNSLLTWFMKKEDMAHLSTLINGATICLNSGSTIAIEAVYLDRPLILTMFDTEEWSEWKSVKRLKEFIHLQKFLSYEAASMPNSLEELHEEIQRYLQKPDYKKEERKNVLEAECYKNDGKATERFVQHISSILHS